MLVLLIATFFPPVIVALLNRGTFGGSTKSYSPKTAYAGAEGMGGWRKSFKYDDPFGGTTQKETADATFYHVFDILMVIKISLSVVFIYSVQYTLNRACATGFQSSGTMKITVTKGGTNFKDLSSAPSVTIDISSGGSIKKYNDPNKLPTTENLTDITTGTPLNPNDKLYIEATGTITTPPNAGEVTIKATLTVSSNQKPLGDKLTLAADTGKDPSSTGLSGSITPQNGTGGKSVTIQTGTIELKGQSLTALKSLTQNAVTLSGTTFRSSASITVTSNAVDLSNLPVDGSNPFTINISNGTIKKLGEKGQPENLERNTTQLTAGDKLFLDATGEITKPVTASDTPVNLEGTIVVTNKDKQAIGQSGLNFGGGPNRDGVSGSLNLQDSESNASTKYINITTSTLKIESTAYTIIKSAYDTTSSSFTIGAADPRNPSTTGATGDADSLWHLLPSDMYDSTDLPYWTSISPILMVLLIATIFPPIIVVILQITDKTTSTKHSPKAYGGWGKDSLCYWHFFDILIVLKISLAAIFIYSLHYRESHTYRSCSVTNAACRFIPNSLCGYWGGSHDADKADGDLTLTPNTSGNYNTNTITINITGATYTNKRSTGEQTLQLSSGGNTLQLTSDTAITSGGQTYTLNRGGLTLNLQTADTNFTPGIYNVFLNITSDINLSGTGGTTITLKKPDADVSLGTYRISGSTTNFTGNPETTDLHDRHQTTKCCMFGSQNTWSTNNPNNRYGWHSFTILSPIKIFLPSILYIQFTTAIIWTIAYGIYRDTKKTVITYPKDKAITGKVTIKAGTLDAKGECTDEAAPTTKLTDTNPNITPPTDTGPTLTITDITTTI